MEINYNDIRLSQLDDISKSILNSTTLKIWLINGEMGAGKTTLIKSLCKNLNVIDNITSPTFSIINEYLTKDNKKIFHFDLYRLDNIEELYDIGIEEYIYSGEYCFIEWPNKKIEYPEHVKLYLKVKGINTRDINITFDDNFKKIT